jgi:hypothetical protein
VSFPLRVYFSFLRPLLRLPSTEAEVTAGAVAGLTVVADSTEVEAVARTRAAAVSVAVEALALARAAEARILTAADDRQFQVMAAHTAALTAARMADRADILRVHPVHTVTAVRAHAARTVTAVLVPARPAG